MSDKTRRVEISFKDLVHSKPQGFRKDKKIILQGPSGCFPAGKLIGILGPSGAGKTTLLNILSSLETKNIQGEIFINGVQRNIDEFRQLSCYITQDDALNALLTVEENMMFTADLKLGYAFETRRKREIISYILEKLGLEECRETRTEKLSGGQRKRLSIAQELIDNPLVMFLDEPTSGLDNFASHQCIKHLKFLAGEGRTIVCTIHQPSASLFQMFDLIYVLAEGRCLYQGESDRLVPFLDLIGVPCNKYHNPADHVMDIAIGDYGCDKINMMVEHINNGKTSLISVEIPTSPPPINLSLTKHIKKSNYYELKILLKREALKLVRNMTLTHLRIIGTVMMAAATGALYWDIGNDASVMWFNYTLILVAQFQNVFCGLVLTLVVFPSEFSVLRKEHFNGYYSVHNFYAAVTLLDIPLSILCCLTANISVYILTSQPLELYRMALFVGSGFMVSIIAQTIGLILGTLMELQQALSCCFITHLPLLIISGYMLNFCDIPRMFQWTSYLSYLRYGLILAFGSVNFFNRPDWDCPDDKFCLYRSGEKFLNTLGVESEGYWWNLIILCVFIVVLKIASYMAMRFKLSQ